MAGTTPTVESLLEEIGPTPSGRLAQYLVDRQIAKSQVGARKLIERAVRSKAINSTDPVRFDRAYLYYLDSQRGKQYAHAVRQILPSKPTFCRVWKSLLLNKGWITSGQIGKHAECLANGIEKRSGGRLHLDTAINQLISLELIEQDGDEPAIFRIGSLFGRNELSRSAWIAKLEFEQRILSMFIGWICNCYSIAYVSKTFRASPLHAVDFNEAYWDGHAPVYFGPFSSSKPIGKATLSQGFLVVDILSYREFTIVDAESMIARTASVGHRWKSNPLVPIVLSAGYSKDAWNRLRAAGIIAVTLENVLGPNISELIRRFSLALATKSPDEPSLKNIEDCLSLAENTIVREDGLISNLKGTMFELLVALGFRAAGFDVVLQKKIKRLDTGQEFEVDILATKGDDVCKIVECKGRHIKYAESRDDIKRHFIDRCRSVADPLGLNVVNRYKIVEAIYITSGTFSDDAIEFAKQVRTSSGVSCSLMARENLVDFLNKEGQSRLVAILKSYYSVPKP